MLRLANLAALVCKLRAESPVAKPDARFSPITSAVSGGDD